MLCPKCKTENAHRSRRKGVLESLASKLAYYPYRCRSCEHRFMHWRYGGVKEAEFDLGPTDRGIRATRQARDWQRRRRDLIIYGLALLLFVAFLSYITKERSAPETGNAARRSDGLQMARLERGSIESRGV